MTVLRSNLVGHLAQAREFPAKRGQQGSRVGVGVGPDDPVRGNPLVSLAERVVSASSQSASDVSGGAAYRFDRDGLVRQIATVAIALPRTRRRRLRGNVTVKQI